jgi:hypothetical protein
MEKQLEITMGAAAAPLAEQLKDFSLPERKIEYLQKVADSITLLLVFSYIPPSQAEKSRIKLLKEIQESIEATN